MKNLFAWVVQFICKVVMLSDANAGHSFGLNEASLNNFYRIFGDVRPSSDIISLIEAG